LVTAAAAFGWRNIDCGSNEKFIGLQVGPCIDKCTLGGKFYFESIIGAMTQVKLGLATAIPFVFRCTHDNIGR